MGDSLLGLQITAYGKPPAGKLQQGGTLKRSDMNAPCTTAMLLLKVTGPGTCAAGTRWTALTRARQVRLLVAPASTTDAIRNRKARL